MPQEIDLNPVQHLTTDAIGPPGQRVFYIQGHQDTRTTTLIVEKGGIEMMRATIVGVLLLVGIFGCNSPIEQHNPSNQIYR